MEPMEVTQLNMSYSPIHTHNSISLMYFNEVCLLIYIDFLTQDQYIQLYSLETGKHMLVVCSLYIIIINPWYQALALYRLLIWPASYLVS